MYRFYRSKSKPYLKQKEALEDLEMQFSVHPVAKIAENSKEVEAKVTAMENMVKVYKKLILKAEAELKKEIKRLQRYREQIKAWIRSPYLGTFSQHHSE